MRTTQSLMFVVSLAANAAPATSPPTFHKDVLPVLQKNCQSCHRAGEAAPMQLLTYQETRPWAKAIRESVRLKKMPPWFADPAHGKFRNERLLTQEELQTLVAWADAGAPEGSRKESPSPVVFVEGWNIGRPDVAFAIPSEYEVPASGTIEYTYYIVPTGFAVDTWVQAAEVRPGARSVVHHVIAFIRPPESKWMRDYKPGEAFVPKRQARSSRGSSSGGNNESEGAPGAELLVGYAPGLQPFVLDPGKAKLVKAGSDIVFQMHYTSNGKPVRDRTRIGLILAKEAPRERVLTINATNAKFVIPPGDPDYKVESQITLRAESTLVSMMPHMHLRGKDFEYRAVYPAGEKEILLSVPRYDFNWQLWYEPSRKVVLPAGTRIECTAHFDNSANNKANPDPTKEVRWGDQSWEEMMIGWMDVAFDAKMDPRDLFREKKSPGGSE